MITHQSRAPHVPGTDPVALLDHIDTQLTSGSVEVAIPAADAAMLSALLHEVLGVDAHRERVGR